MAREGASSPSKPDDIESSSQSSEAAAEVTAARDTDRRSEEEDDQSSHDEAPHKRRRSGKGCSKAPLDGVVIEINSDDDAAAAGEAGCGPSAGSSSCSSNPPGSSQAAQASERRRKGRPCKHVAPGPAAGPSAAPAPALKPAPAPKREDPYARLRPRSKQDAAPKPAPRKPAASKAVKREAHEGSDAGFSPLPASASSGAPASKPLSGQPRASAASKPAPGKAGGSKLVATKTCNHPPCPQPPADSRPKYGNKRFGFMFVKRETEIEGRDLVVEANRYWLVEVMGEFFGRHGCDPKYEVGERGTWNYIIRWSGWGQEYCEPYTEAELDERFRPLSQRPPEDKIAQIPGYVTVPQAGDLRLAEREAPLPMSQVGARVCIFERIAPAPENLDHPKFQWAQEATKPKRVQYQVAGTCDDGCLWLEPSCPNSVWTPFALPAALVRPLDSFDSFECETAAGEHEDDDDGTETGARKRRKKAKQRKANSKRAKRGGRGGGGGGGEDSDGESSCVGPGGYLPCFRIGFDNACQRAQRRFPGKWVHTPEGAWRPLVEMANRCTRCKRDVRLVPHPLFKGLVMCSDGVWNVMDIDPTRDVEKATCQGGSEEDEEEEERVVKDKEKRDEKYCCLGGCGGHDDPDLAVCDNPNCIRAYGYECIRDTFGDGADEVVRKAKKWKCFVCTGVLQECIGADRSKAWAQLTEEYREHHFARLESLADATNREIDRHNAEVRKPDFKLRWSGLNERAPEDGLVVISLCDGIGATFLGLLKNSLKIRHYIAIDKDSSLRDVVTILASGMGFETGVDAANDAVHPHAVTTYDWDLSAPDTPARMRKLVRELNEKHGRIDLLVAGWPCNDLAGNNPTADGLEGEQSGLWKEVLKTRDLVWESNPGLAFKFENLWHMNGTNMDGKRVKSAEHLDQAFGVAGITIDGILFSPSHRKRRYWTNLTIPRVAPDRSGCMLQDYLEGGSMRLALVSHVSTITTEGGRTEEHKSGRDDGQAYNKFWKRVVQNRDTRRKSKLMIEELERLMGFPKGYTSCLTATGPRRKAIGNSFNVLVVAHIFRGLLRPAPAAPSLAPAPSGLAPILRLPAPDAALGAPVAGPSTAGPSHAAPQASPAAPQPAGPSTPPVAAASAAAACEGRAGEDDARSRSPEPSPLPAAAPPPPPPVIDLTGDD